MLPSNSILRSMCVRLELDADVASSIARMEREEGADYGAVELIATFGEELPEWAVSQVYEEFGFENDLIGELLDAYGLS